MFKTKNDLSEEIRAKAVELLNARLADCIDLQTQTKLAHWNVKGPTNSHQWPRDAQGLGCPNR
jgi:starvation-inducible DNA-binding protein